MKTKLIPLNMYSEMKSKPKRCISHNWSDCGFDSPLKDGISFEKRCKDCEWRVDERCGYKEYTTEIAKGDLGDDSYYLQFCCAECGELIQLITSISYIFHDLCSHIQECEHCGTPHRYIDDDGELMYTFGVPVVRVKK
jgi:hypothetical protein